VVVTSLELIHSEYRHLPSLVPWMGMYNSRMLLELDMALPLSGPLALGYAVRLFATPHVNPTCHHGKIFSRGRLVAGG